jgi:hypothetical protein
MSAPAGATIALLSQDARTRKEDTLIRRLAALVAALGLALLSVAPAIAAPITNPLPISSDATGFEGGDCAGVQPGQVVWHFVAHTTDQFETLTVTFSTAGTMPDLVADKVTDTYELQWFVTTGSPDTLVDADTSGDGNLQLSHICDGGPPPEIPEAPASVLLILTSGLAGLGFVGWRMRRSQIVA